MTIQEIIRVLDQLDKADSNRVCVSIVAGYLRGAHDQGKLADTIASMLGLAGIVIISFDDLGAHIDSGTLQGHPRANDVEVLANKIHEAVMPILSSKLKMTS